MVEATGLQFFTFRIALANRTCGWLLSLLFCGCATTVLAQPDERETGNSGTTNFPDVLGELTLPVDAMLYMLDEDGEPVLVPNVSVQELKQFREQASGVAGVPFQYQQIRVSVVADDQVADLSGRFAVKLGPGARKAEVPLKFGTCQLGIEPPQIESQRTNSQFFSDATGYRWTILSTEPSESGETPLEHIITLAGKSRITQESDRNNLRISLPVHPCLIEVMLPPNAADERVRSEDIVEREVTSEGVRLKVNSRGGEFTLTWRSRDANTPVASVEAQSRTTLEVGDPRQAWKATTNLTVRWYGNDASDRFRVQLPAGARWRTPPQPDFGRYSISERSLDNPGEDSQASTAAPIELLVENFDPAETQTIDMLLEWEWVPGDDENESYVVKTNIPALTVGDVSVHRGTVNCVYSGLYSVVFQEGNGTQLIQQGRVADGFGSQQLQFGFSQQPVDLSVTFRREKSLPTVRPTYQIAVDENKLVMTAWLDCSFNVNQHRIEVGLNFGNWILQDNTAKVLSTPDDPFSSEGDVLAVRLGEDGNYFISGSDPDPSSFSTGRRLDQVWRLVAERSWTPDENNELEFRLPEIIRGSATGQPVMDHESGALIVIGDDNILLQRDEVASTGLLSDSFSAESQKYVDRQTVRKPLAYRFQSRGATPTWAGRAELLPQAMTVQGDVQLEVLDGQVAIFQDFDLQVANVPWSQQTVAVRTDACELEPQFYVNGILTYSQLTSTVSESQLAVMLSNANPPAAETDAADESEATWNLYQLLGAPDVLGNSQLSVRSYLSWQTSAFDPADADSEQPELGPVQVDVPLARPLFPLSARQSRPNLDVASEYQVAIFLPGRDESEEWSQVVKPRQLSSETSQLRLNIQPLSEATVDALVRIENCWLQTAIDGRQRRDRFVARVRSDSRQIAIRLPEQAYARNPSPQVLLGGALVRQPNVVYDASTDQWLIQVPEDFAGKEFTLEVIYSVRTSLSSWTSLKVAAPQILAAEHRGRFYWQLATPKTSHLVRPPSPLTSEWQWRWGGLFWYRQSVREERDLISWFDATEVEQLPASANQYLMSGRFPASPFQVLVVSRFIFWFPIGTFAILLTALLINLPFLRRPEYAAGLALLISTSAMVYPDVGVLLGQTSLAALGLVALVLTTQVAIESRVRRRSVFTSRPSTYADGSDNFSVHRSVRVSEAPTAVPAGSSVAAGGEKP